MHRLLKAHYIHRFGGDIGPNGRETQAATAQSNMLFLTQAHRFASSSILLSFRVAFAQSVVGVPNIMGTLCANSAELQAMSMT